MILKYFKIFIDHKLLFICNGTSGLKVYDKTNISDLKMVNHYKDIQTYVVIFVEERFFNPIPSPFQRKGSVILQYFKILIDHRLLFICNGTSSLKVYDKTNINDLKMANHYKDIQTYDVIPLGEHFFNPIPSPFQRKGSVILQYFKIFINHGLLFIFDGTSGLKIYDISGST